MEDITSLFQIKGIEFTERQGFVLKHSVWDARQVLYNVLLRTVEYLHVGGVKGDVAEFGVQHGQQALVLAGGIQYQEAKWPEPEKRSLHLFDTFGGYPEFDNDIDREAYADFEPDREGMPGTGYFLQDTPEAMAKRSATPARRILGTDRVVTHVGDFADTLPKLDKDQLFAFISIDCNTYGAASKVLDYVFENNALADGAVILFGGGWYYHRASPKYGYRRAWKEVVEKHDVRYSDEGQIEMLGRKFIFHKA